MNKDLEHLKMLSIGYYVYAGLIALFACFPLIHVAIGVSMILGNFDTAKDAPPAFAGWIFVIVGGLFIIGGWATAICTFLAGKYLRQQRNHTFCLVMAGISCMFAPLGTVLGVFTIIVLLRDSVKQLFSGQAVPMIQTNYSPQSWQQ